MRQHWFDGRAVKTGKRQEASLPVIIPCNLCPQPIMPGSGGGHHTPQPCQANLATCCPPIIYYTVRVAPARDLRLDPSMPASAAGLTQQINTELTAKSDRRTAAQHKTWLSGEKM